MLINAEKFTNHAMMDTQQGWSMKELISLRPGPVPLGQECSNEPWNYNDYIITTIRTMIMAENHEIILYSEWADFDKTNFTKPAIKKG